MAYLTNEFSQPIKDRVEWGQHNHPTKQMVTDKVTVMSFQSPEVVRAIETSQFLVPQTSNARKDAYSYLKQLIHFNNNPWFGILPNCKANIWGVSPNQQICIVQELPVTELHIHNYYTWTDIMYYFQEADKTILNNWTWHPDEKMDYENYKVLVDHLNHLDKSEAIEVCFPNFCKQNIIGYYYDKERVLLNRLDGSGGHASVSLEEVQHLPKYIT